METRKCKECGKTLTVDNFYIQVHKTKRKKDGTVPTNYSSYCKHCEKVKRDARRSIRANVDLDNARRRERMKDPAYRAKLAKQKQISSKRDPAKYVYNHVKARAKLRGIQFNIDPSDIVIPEVCPLLGIPIEFGSAKNYSNSPSLDRLNPTLGYVKGNVWVISNKANTMKSNATVLELENFCNNALKLIDKMKI